MTLDNIILASIPNALSKPVRVGYMLTEGRKQAKIPKDAPVLRWNEFLRRGAATIGRTGQSGEPGMRR